jgi:hypothetical protein
VGRKRAKKKGGPKTALCERRERRRFSGRCIYINGLGGSYLGGEPVPVETEHPQPIVPNLRAAHAGIAPGKGTRSGHDFLVGHVTFGAYEGERFGGMPRPLFCVMLGGTA